VLYDKHPLSNYSKVLKVWIDGHQYFDRDQDLKGRVRLAAGKKDLLDKEKAAEDAAKRQNGPAGKGPDGTNATPPDKKPDAPPESRKEGAR
jgi:hypothetical protein